jgi:hypothetical protein
MHYNISVCSVTVNSILSGLIMGRRYTNGQKPWIIQNVVFGAFAKLHKSLYSFYTTGIYSEE